MRYLCRPVPNLIQCVWQNMSGIAIREVRKKMENGVSGSFWQLVATSNCRLICEIYSSVSDYVFLDGVASNIDMIIYL